MFGSAQEHKSADKARLRELHAKIGELTLENDFLAKALGRQRARVSRNWI